MMIFLGGGGCWCVDANFAYLFSEWYIVGYGKVHYGICEFGLFHN